MNRVLAGIIGSSLIVSAPSLGAQEAPGVMAQVIRVQPITGHSQPFEDGVQQHSAWVSDEGGEWSWIAFEVVMGARTGEYLFGTFNHAYADWDTPDVDPQASGASVDEKIAPHVEDVEVSMMRLHPDLSIIVPDAPLAPMYEVVTMEVAMGKTAQFQVFMAGLKSAFETAGVPARYFVYEGAHGTVANTWTVSIPHANFAALGGGGDMQEMTRETLGTSRSDALWDMADETLVSMTSDIFVLRPDLSINLPPM